MMTDVDLFAWVVTQLQHGHGYYATMAVALAHGESASVFNWRPPLLYLVLGALPWTMSPTLWGVLLTEVWAGLLIALSSLTAKRVSISAVFAGLAVMVRELAAPYLLIRLLLARRGERRPWLVACGLCGVYYFVHWSLVWWHLDPDAIHGDSWVSFGGVTQLLRTVTPNPLSVVLGSWAGWGWLLLLAGVIASATMATADRLTLACYALAFLVVGRSAPTHNSAVWGFVVMPLQCLTIWQWSVAQIDRWVV